MRAERTRDWHKVSNKLRLNAKYVDLSIGAKLAYRTLLEVAKDADNGGFFGSVRQMKTMLPGELERFVDAVVRSDLIDRVDGGLQIHDFEAWQQFADPAARDRQRKRRERIRQQVEETVDITDASRKRHGRVTDKSSGGNGGKLEVSDDVPDENPSENRGASRRKVVGMNLESARELSKSEGTFEHESPETVTDKSRTRHGLLTRARIDKDIDLLARADRRSIHPRDAGELFSSPTDANDEFESLIDALVMAGVWLRPTKKMIEFLRRLVADHRQDRVEAAIAEQMRSGPITDDFMGQVAKRLRLAAERRTIDEERARVESNRRQIEEEQRRIEQLRAADPEAERVAAAHRDAIAAFANALGSPTMTPKEGSHA